MAILVFGSSGQVATELRRIGNVHSLDRNAADLRYPKFCAEAIYDHRPDAIVNAAAYTAVDDAETNEPLARVVNADSPTAMARAAASLKIPFVQISTDFVFDGSKSAPYSTADLANPLNAYGRGKYAGERGIVAARGIYVILRTSWVFSAVGRNFVTAILDGAKSRDELAVVGDQFGGPTSANSVAAACISIAHQLAERQVDSGIYHFSGSPDVSRADFAREIISRAGSEVQVRNISTGDLPSAAFRPVNSRMDCSELQRKFGIRRPDWRKDLVKVLQDIGS